MRYNHKISIIFLIMLCPFFIRGQFSKFQLGIEGGPGVSTTRLDPFFYPSKWCEAKGGYIIGMALCVTFTNRYSLKTNLSYEKFFIGEEWSYFLMPVLNKIKIGRTRSFFANFGQYFSYAFSIPVDEWRKYDLGVAIGGGFETPFSNKLSINVEFRNYTGFIGLWEGSRYTCISTIQIGILYNFAGKDTKQ